MTLSPDRTRKYLNILVEPIRVCAAYRPKFGQGVGAGLTVTEFQTLYGGDPFYSWFGLDNAMMYAAHKTAGGITSIYRQIGIAGERLFRAVLVDELGLSDDQVTWSYTVQTAGGRTRRLSLDGRIPLDFVADTRVRERVADWIRRAAADLDVAPAVIETLKGVVFEIRQGYKSKDSKRQNADIANATNSYAHAYLPCLLILSTQIDTDIQVRYRNTKWAVLTGLPDEESDLRSTYEFMRQVVGFDLAGFFAEHSPMLKQEVHRVLKNLLSPK